MVRDNAQDQAEAELRAEPREAYRDANDPMNLCDYCPHTEFDGDVCPTCGYDYSSVTD